MLPYVTKEQRNSFAFLYIRKAKQLRNITGE